jgi:DUF4097 and DUF4098 domain-containing protein YvlB
MFKDTKANKILMIAILAILFIMIIGNKSTKNKKTTFNEIDLSNSISIDSLSDVNIWVDDSLSSANIVYSNKGNGELEVKSSNGNTTVKENLKKRFFLSIDFEDDSSTISLYLPSSMINDLEIHSISGDINTYNKIQANNININNTSGKIGLLDIDAAKIDIESISGDISTGMINNVDSLNIKSTSGEISIEELKSKNVSIKSVSSDIQISKSDVSDNFKLSTISGDIEVVIEKGSNFDIKTTTGTIDINDKEIDGNSYSQGNGNSLFKTISGNIEIDY